MKEKTLPEEVDKCFKDNPDNLEKAVKCATGKLASSINSIGANMQFQAKNVVDMKATVDTEVSRAADLITKMYPRIRKMDDIERGVNGIRTDISGIKSNVQNINLATARIDNKIDIVGARLDGKINDMDSRLTQDIGELREFGQKTLVPLLNKAIKMSEKSTEIMKDVRDAVEY